MFASANNRASLWFQAFLSGIHLLVHRDAQASHSWCDLFEGELFGRGTGESSWKSRPWNTWNLSGLCGGPLVPGSGQPSA